MAEPDNWDDEGFEPEIAPRTTAAGDKWVGEDEEDVKDNWDEEEDENKEGTVQCAQVKKKKSLKDRIAEKEAQKAAEIAEKRKREEETRKLMSPEAALAEKMRQQKMQEESDLALAREAFGVKMPSELIDKFFPSTKEDFDTFQNLLKDKITPYEKSPFYMSFLEDLYRNLAVGLESDEVKKLASALNTLGNEKTKSQKGKIKKKKAPKLMAGKVTDMDSYGDMQEDYDDFI